MVPQVSSARGNKLRPPGRGKARAAGSLLGSLPAGSVRMKQEVGERGDPAGFRGLKAGSQPRWQTTEEGGHVT